jgi:hypothetical protein
MIVPRTPKNSRLVGRPAFRVLCAWCEEPIEQTRPAAGPLKGTSHGICAPCARRYFGLNLDVIAEGALCA